MNEHLEMLYDLSRSELRSLAWEALLISDGPDRVAGDVNSTIEVHYGEEAGAHIFHLVSPSL